MNKILIPLIAVFFFLSSSKVIAQCGNELVEIAAAQSGNDALYLKEFKVTFDRGKRKKPAPVARFNTILNNGKLYRFTVANAKEYEGEVILQLYYKNKLLGSTFDLIKNDDIQTFDYQCTNTATYQILMSFREGKEGCAVGVMSLVIDDSTRIDDPVFGIDSLEVLYIGIDNPIIMAASGIPEGTIEFEIDQGEITGEKGNYIVRVEKEGTAIITVITKDKNGKVKETSTAKFKVKKIPLPKAMVANMQGGIISKEHLLEQDIVQLLIPPSLYNFSFRVLEFTISERYDGSSGEISIDNKFTIQQKRLIENLQPGAKIFIKNIVTEGPDGVKTKLNPLGFIIE
jgi:hypothetical protein